MEDDDTMGTDDGIDLEVGAGSDGGDDDFAAALAEHRAELAGVDADNDGDGDDAGERGPSDDDPTARLGEGPPRPKSRSREESVVRRMQLAEERSLRLEQELKAMRAKTATPSPPMRTSGDPVDDLWNMAAAELGCDRSDPRVRARIFEITGDVMADLESDSTDPEIRARNERRTRERERKALQAQIDEMKRDREAREQAATIERNREHGMRTMREHLTDSSAEESFPHLYAAEDDPVSAVFDGLRALVEAGHAIDDSNAADTIAYVCATIDRDHAVRLERLEALKSRSSGQKPQPTPNQSRREAAPVGKTRGALKDGPRNRREDRGGRTVTASGVGSRQAPATKSDAEKTPDEIFEEMLAERREAQRRQSRPGR